MKYNTMNCITTDWDANVAKAELVIEGHRVRLNFLPSGSIGGLEDAKRMLKRAFVERKVSEAATL